MSDEIYDVIIVGTGPAGYSAGLYAKRFNLNTLVIGTELGGMITKAAEVENYPGFRKISGFELMNEFYNHIVDLGVKIEMDTIKKAFKKDGLFVLQSDTKTYVGKTVILCTGSKKRRLNLEGEEKYSGKGVCYCTTCDAPFYRNKEVAIVGGSDGAVIGAIHLSQFASKVNLIYRGSALRAKPARIDAINANEKVNVILNANVKTLEGSPYLSSIVLDNGDRLNVEGLFVEIGSIPSTFLAEELGADIENKLIKVDVMQKTNVEGLFAAGDVTTNSALIKQVVVAAGEGSKAAYSAFHYLS